MTTQISAETLSPLSYYQLPVITTELLAKLYGTEPLNIQVNHTRNKERFVEGKHYFKVAGDELKSLRLTLSKSQSKVNISPKTRSLLLWTERGAARHARMLETDQAWEVFEKLEDCYFSQHRKPLPATPQHKDYDSRVLCYQRNGVTLSTMKLREDELVISLDSWLSLAKQNGWLVFRKDELIDRIKRL